MTPDLPPADRPPDDPAALRARLDALEARVVVLEASRARALDAARRSAPGGAAPASDARPRRLPSWRLPEARSEDLLGKLGVALLLVGVLFLLKWAVDQGLLTAAVRVAGAGALGVALVAAGARLRASRPVLARLLAGGGLAALYGTLWTAAVLYPAMPAAVAFVGLAAVAAAGFWLALAQTDGALATVAAAGGLVTPLLLYREPATLGLLAVYAALVLGASGAAWARRGWPGLLAANALGGWGVVLTAWLVEGGGPDVTGRWPFTALVLVAWGVAGVLPLVRPSVPAAGVPFALRPLVWAPVVSALVGVSALDAAWDWPRGVAVGVAALLAVAHAAWARTLAGVPPADAGLPAAPPSRLASPTSRFVPAALAAAALAVWAAGRATGFGELDARFLAVGVAAGAALVLVSRAAREPETVRAGHALALASAAALAVALWAAVGAPWESGGALDAGRMARLLLAAALGAVALGAVGFRSARGGTARAVYLTAAHVTVLAALRVLLLPGGGPAVTSAAWGLAAVALVVVGLARRDGVLRALGLGTVVTTAAKVLIVDLPDVPVVWRVVLFMGLGALLLAVSYAVPGLLRVSPADGEREPTAP